jgi:hypothetical protein
VHRSVVVVDSLRSVLSLQPRKVNSQACLEESFTKYYLCFQNISICCLLLEQRE